MGNRVETLNDLVQENENAIETLQNEREELTEECHELWCLNEELLRRPSAATKKSKRRISLVPTKVDLGALEGGSYSSSRNSFVQAPSNYNALGGRSASDVWERLQVDMTND